MQDISLLQHSKKKFLLALLACTFIFYGFSLPFSLTGQPHFSPSNDFSNHAHFMDRFAESFKRGQIIPRTIVKPTSFSDATPKTQNIPTFQYYGFFDGLAGLPFHLLGLSDATSAVLSSIIVRYLGLWILFETCLLMGASLPISFLACFSLLISPYTLTVFYGRGALAEAFAQSLLTLIPLGYMLGHYKRYYAATLIFCLAIFLLALCHNIFLLYGLVFLGVIVLFSGKLKMMLSAGCGTTLGILLSAWQWFPAKASINDIALVALITAKDFIGGIEVKSATLSGAFGILHPFKPAGVTEPFPLYLTIGWWTIPFIFLAIRTFIRDRQKSFLFPFIIAFYVFFVMTFYPCNERFWRYLPNNFSILQDSYRLLGFLSLLGAIGFAGALSKINRSLFKALIILMLLSQLPVFYCFMKLVSHQTWTNDQVRGSPINYYFTTPTANLNQSIHTDLVRGFDIKQNDGTLSAKNSFYVSPEKTQQFFVRVKGIVSQPNDTFQLAIVPLRENPDTQQLETISIQSDPVPICADFSVLLSQKTASPSGWYKMVVLRTDNLNKTIPPITITQFDIIPNALTNFIANDDVELVKKPYGYSQFYRVKADVISQFKPDAEGYYTVELPAAFSKFFVVKQTGHILPTSVDFNHRILVRTQNLTDPIKVTYTLDRETLGLSLLGIIGLILVILRQRKESREIKI